MKGRPINEKGENAQKGRFANNTLQARKAFTRKLGDLVRHGVSWVHTVSRGATHDCQGRLANGKDRMEWCGGQTGQKKKNPTRLWVGGRKGLSGDNPIGKLPPESRVRSDKRSSDTVVAPRKKVLKGNKRDHTRSGSRKPDGLRQCGARSGEDTTKPNKQGRRPGEQGAGRGIATHK